MIDIYIGNASDTARPFSVDDPDSSQPLDNWELVASGKTYMDALYELVEQANDENIAIENSWLRVVETK